MRNATAMTPAIGAALAVALHALLAGAAVADGAVQVRSPRIAADLPRGLHVVVSPVPGYGPPPGLERRPAYGWCRAKIGRLHEFRRRVAYDGGRVAFDEARIASSLSADLVTSCGYRTPPKRHLGWYER